MTTHEQTQQIARSLNDKAYSETFVEAEITTTVPFQIRAMRKERHWTQKDLASKTGQHQKTISDFENPDIGPQSITSLRKIAAAFDVGLVVRFAPFSELVEWSANISRRSHFVPSRTADTKLRAQQCGKPMTDDIRLRELATIGARHSHISAGIQWPRGAAGHEFTGGKDCGFASCPHPDCVLVRTPAAPDGWQDTLKEMRRASALVDAAHDATEYQIRMVALALIARELLRRLPAPREEPIA